MFMKKVLVAGMVSAALILAGCASPQPYATPSPTPMPGLVVTPVPATVAPTEQLTPAATSAITDQTTGASDEKDLEYAKAIQTEVNKMTEVSKSSVLVMGDAALVGVQFAEQYKGELTDRIKDMIVKKAEAANSGIKRVAVTADEAQYKRVEDLATKLTTGSTMSQISLEVSELLNGLLPTT